MQRIEERLAALERSAGRWRAFAIALGLLAVASLSIAANGVAPAATTADRVTAKEFVVADADGKPVAVLGSSNGAGGLNLYRAPADVACTLGPTFDRHYVLHILEDQTPTVTLGTYARQSSPHLVLTNPKSKTRISMTADTHDARASFFSNDHFRPLEILTNDGGGIITIFNKDMTAKWQAQ